MKSISVEKKPELWASIARIIACGMIFVYHHAGLYGKSLNPLDFYAILIFVFLSGYFSFQNDASNKKFHITWLFRRIKSIMIPYWQVILFVIVVNEICKYKDTTPLKNLIIMLGGSMFLDDPLYVISWFITLILMLYFFIFAFNISSNKSYKVFIFAIGFTFSVVLNKYFYFLAFCCGYAFKPVKEKHIDSSITLNISFTLSKVFFLIQNYCYSFFLLHGGVLVLLIKVFELSPVNSFIVSFVITLIAAFFHHNFSVMLQKKAILPFEANHLCQDSCRYDRKSTSK